MTDYVWDHQVVTIHTAVRMGLEKTPPWKMPESAWQPGDSHLARTELSPMPVLAPGDRCWLKYMTKCDPPIGCVAERVLFLRTT